MTSQELEVKIEEAINQPIRYGFFLRGSG